MRHRLLIERAKFIDIDLLDKIYTTATFVTPQVQLPINIRPYPHVQKSDRILIEQKLNELFELDAISFFGYDFEDVTPMSTRWNCDLLSREEYLQMYSNILEIAERRPQVIIREKSKLNATTEGLTEIVSAKEALFQLQLASRLGSTQIEQSAYSKIAVANVTADNNYTSIVESVTHLLALIEVPSALAFSQEDVKGLRKLQLSFSNDMKMRILSKSGESGGLLNKSEIIATELYKEYIAEMEQLISTITPSIQTTTSNNLWSFAISMLSTIPLNMPLWAKVLRYYQSRQNYSGGLKMVFEINQIKKNKTK